MFLYCQYYYYLMSRHYSYYEGPCSIMRPETASLIDTSNGFIQYTKTLGGTLKYGMSDSFHIY